MGKVVDYLSVTCGKMTVICQLHGAGCQLSVSYMGQDDSYASATWGRLTIICQLHETR